MMDSISVYAKQIKAHCPGLSIDSILLNEDGQYNDVLIVDGAFAFRFATVPDAVDTMRREIAILNVLQDRLPVAIPYPIYATIDAGVIGECFVGYHLIPGKPLWREAFSEITQSTTLDHMAKQLAGFMQELHHLPVPMFESIDLPLEDTFDGWTEMYEQFREKLFPYMRPDACQTVAQTFDGYLSDPALHHFDPCLRHGDFGTGNIIHDAESGSITGIIDFGCACLGDPAVDFGGLLGSYGRDFYDRCSATYPEMKAALPRVLFAVNTFALQEALFGIENDDREAFEAGIADYR